MKKFYTLAAAAVLTCSAFNFAFAQAKKVLYITQDKPLTGTSALDANATPINNDPIIRMLKADPNFDVTVNIIETGASTLAPLPTGTTLASYDVIVVQESIGGGNALLTPTGALALATLPKPTLFNKNFAFSNNRAVGGNASSSDVSTAGNPVLTMNVAETNRTNPIFSGITFNSEGTIPVFSAGATDQGGDPGTAVPKGFSFNNSVVINPANRPLATFPANGTIAIAETGTPVFLNDVAAGTTLTGSTATTGQQLQSRVIFFPMNFGAITRTLESGTGPRTLNITAEGLTMWRNAIYILAGLTPPNTLVNPSNLITSSKPEVANAFFNLGQNYPNPTNGSTTIQFELKKAGAIALEVFDITGRKVATLAEGNKAAGAHEVRFVNTLTSGVYFYKLSANGVSATRKMVVSN